MMAKNLELLSEQASSVVNGGVAVPATSPVTPPVKAMPLTTPTAVAKPTVAPVSRPRPAPKLRDVLKAAKPNWTEKDLTAVVEKLLRAQVTGFPELRDALHSSGSAALNERLRAAGQKVFAAETITALKSRVDLEDPPKPVIELNPELPKQRWEVLHDLAMIRDAPSLGARAVARKDKGEIIESVEETFDGFLKLPDQAGWCAKDCQGKLGLGQLLRRLGPSVPMATEILTNAGPQAFEVVFQPSVAVRSAPSTSANIISARRFGEVILAETQTYHGWLRLAEDAGWMLSQHPQHGMLLKPAFQSANARTETVRQSETVEASTSQNVPRPPCVSANDERMAEQRRREEQQRLEQRRNEEEAQKLREQQEAQRRKAMQEEQERVRRETEAKQRAEEEKVQAALAVQMAAEQDELLETFAEAAASGDPMAIKKARDAAKKGGVPTKEIARVFALAQAQRPAE